MNVPVIAIISFVLLPVALAVVWFHRFAFSYRATDYDVAFEELAEEKVNAPSQGRYEPPKPGRPRNYAVSMLSEAGF